MHNIQFTSKKRCPYCTSYEIEYIDLSDLLGTTYHDINRIHINKYVFKCSNCRELFYYTGVLDTAERQADA